MGIRLLKASELPEGELIGDDYGGIPSCVIFVDLAPGEGPKLQSTLMRNCSSWPKDRRRSVTVRAKTSSLQVMWRSRLPISPTASRILVPVGSGRSMFT